jgi:transcriptional antiterminator RfaH
MVTMEKRWYVLRTKPNSESLAAANLERQGYELFLPRVTAPQVKHGGYRMVPLFPGYLFLRCADPYYGWPQVQYTPGVLGWVQLGGETPAVPDQVVDELAERVTVINSTGGLWRRFKPGERVVVTSGRLEGLARVLEGPKTPEGRVRVLMEFLGQLVTATVPWEDVQEVQGDSLVSGRKRGRRTRGAGRWIKGFGPCLAANAST